MTKGELKTVELSLYCILLSSIVVYIAHAAPYPMTKVGWSRQVLRLTQKVRRENEPPESAQLNFGATFRGIFSLWLPCWAQIWILQHINSVFLMRNRIHSQNSQRNHLLSLILSFGTLFDKWISHIHHMDLSFAGVLFLYNSTLKLVQLTWNDHTSENAVF